MQPLSVVASSRANQKPVTDTGSVHKKVWSVWQTTSPPMLGCLKMYIDWRTTGSTMPMPWAISPMASECEKRSNTGSRSWSAWPILLIDVDFDWRSVPSASKASSSKKNDTRSPDARKYSSDVSSWSVVEKIDVTPSETGSNASTSSLAREVSVRRVASGTKSGTTRKPSRSKSARWDAVKLTPRAYGDRVAMCVGTGVPRGTHRGSRRGR